MESDLVKYIASHMTLKHSMRSYPCPMSGWRPGGAKFSAWGCGAEVTVWELTPHTIQGHGQEKDPQDRATAEEQPHPRSGQAGTGVGLESTSQKEGKEG